LQTFKGSGLRVEHLEELSSVWDWEPPTADTGASGAWHILRQLAVTANK